jgi:hypothetical protein
MRARFHVDADHRFAQGAQVFDAGVAKVEAVLVFILWVKGVVALAASGVGLDWVLYFYVDVGMDFKRMHGDSPSVQSALRMPVWNRFARCSETT